MQSSQPSREQQEEEEEWPPVSSSSSSKLPMSLPEYSRYGRQMILSDFGLPSQLKLRNSKVLVIGAGGLGCPAIQYLAAAGVGYISIVDHDVVEPSNLARQILHTDSRVGLPKAQSIAKAVSDINPYVKINPIITALTSTNSTSLISSHDLVLDCTDNPLTRYLISDSAVICGKQVVSGAAQGYEGQLMVLHKELNPKHEKRDLNPDQKDSISETEKNHEQNQDREKGRSTSALGVERGPCYRCLFPKAPSQNQVTNCEDGGVLGGITGLVGTLQAIETIKLLTGIGEDTPPSLLLCSPLSSTPFRTIKLRPRRKETCRSCGDPEKVGKDQILTHLEKEDYRTFCGINTVEDDERLSNSIRHLDVKDMSKSRDSILLDVRPSIEFGIAKLPESINVPFTTLRRNPNAILKQLETISSNSTTSNTHLNGHSVSSSQPIQVEVLCRRGNDSREAVKLLSEANASNQSSADNHQQSKIKFEFVNVRGGLRAFSKNVDSEFPIY